MKIELINPFIEATATTLETMCGLKPVRNGALTMSNGLISTYDFIGVLGLSGSVKGAVVMSLPVEVGKAVVGKFVGEQITEVGSDLMDGFGEILNIVAGAAAAKIPNHKINLSLPTVMIGHDQLIHSRKEEPWVVIPLKLVGIGDFNICVSMTEGN